MTSEEQAKKELVAQYFGRVASTFDQVGPGFFKRAGRRLVELAEIPAGARVLDVAAGRGAILFAAAEQASAKGRVVGIDLADAMVQETGADIGRRGVKNAVMRQMDAEHLDFPDGTFDRVLCGFALFFFPHLERALAEFYRVLKPEGRAAATTFGSRDERWNWYNELLESYRAMVKLATHALDKPADLEAAMRGAGFGDIQVMAEPIDVVFTGAEEWWSVVEPDLQKRMESSVLERFKVDAFTKLETLREADGIHRRYQVLFTLAGK